MRPIRSPEVHMSTRLLLVDDHRMLREGLRRSLADAGFEIVGEAEDGQTAITAVAVYRPDVVLMDVTMPIMDGVTATREIIRDHPDVAVVMLTMHADEAIIASAIAAGAVGYLVKDCSTDEIVETLRAAAGGDTTVSAELADAMLREVDRLPGPIDDGHQIVSKREVEVLQLIADGCSTPEVADTLFISQKTVKNHLASIYQKLDARDRTQAVLAAVRRGIIRLS